MRSGVGERLLTSKLQILNGVSNRRPSIALSILTGRVTEQLSILESYYSADPVITNELPESSSSFMLQRRQRQYEAHTVYLSEAHLRDIDDIIEAIQQDEPKRLTRSAVLRKAVEHLRTAVETDPAKL